MAAFSPDGKTLATSSTGNDAPLSKFTATDTWQATMLGGFLPDASFMHFIEPMVTQDPDAGPELHAFRSNARRFGRSTQYPTECVVH